MATTSKMAIPYPASTDFVKDGATAMQDLAEEVDAKTGLVFIKSQTIGTAVSSVTVSDAFSASYDNYLITISGGSGSAVGLLKMTVGATVTNYYSNIIYTSWNNTVTGSGTTSGTGWQWAGYHGTGIAGEIFIGNPYLSKPTWMRSTWFSLLDAGFVAGYLNNTTSYTSFTLAPSSGTLTGGTIRVYGYNQ